MQIDPDYSRDILESLIEAPTSYATLAIFDENDMVDFSDQPTIHKLHTHLLALQDIGAITSDNPTRNLGITYSAQGNATASLGARIRITAQGRDFFSATNDPTIWEKSKQVLTSQGAQVAFAVTAELAKQAAMKAVGL